MLEVERKASASSEMEDSWIRAGIVLEMGTAELGGRHCFIPLLMSRMIKKVENRDVVKYVTK